MESKKFTVETIITANSPYWLSIRTNKMPFLADAIEQNALSIARWGKPTKGDFVDIRNRLIALKFFDEDFNFLGNDYLVKKIQEDLKADIDAGRKVAFGFCKLMTGHSFFTPENRFDGDRLAMVNVDFGNNEVELVIEGPFY